jgi:nucleotide-binding universal stress UspA family protein
MFNKIYVPIDNSDVADKVLNEALNLVKGFNGELRFVHVVNFEQVSFGIQMLGAGDLKKTLIEIANQVIDHIKDTLNQKQVKASVVLLENYSSDMSKIIIDDATSWGADLFILGTHHLGSFSHFLSGGVAEDIAKKSDIPILLITKHRQA